MPDGSSGKKQAKACRDNVGISSDVADEIAAKAAQNPAFPLTAAASLIRRPRRGVAASLTQCCDVEVDT